MVTRRTRAAGSAAVMAALALAGCGASMSRTPIIVPPEAVREWAYLPDGQTAPGRYVIRMTDGRREWEVEFPDAAYGSEVRVPLKAVGGAGRLAPDRLAPTGADRELDEDRRSRASATIEEPGFQDATPAGPAPIPAQKGAPPPSRPKKSSYLVGIAQVRELYGARNYEIALVHLVDLERDYPNDEKILAMKGSIYRRLGRNKLAREAWEKVLVLNPDNQVVAAAMRELAEEEAATSNNRRDSDGAGGEAGPDGPGR